VPQRRPAEKAAASHPEGETPMPFVNIRIVKEVIADDPAGKKAAISQRVADAITEATGIGRSDIWVVFEEVAARDWFVGSTSVETMRGGK
jgi:4-oxalocrotonate tautomerase